VNKGAIRLEAGVFLYLFDEFSFVSDEARLQVLREEFHDIIRL
jgi:hypothetical protein